MDNETVRFTVECPNCESELGSGYKTLTDTVIEVMLAAFPRVEDMLGALDSWARFHNNKYAHRPSWSIHSS